MKEIKFKMEEEGPVFEDPDHEKFYDWMCKMSHNSINVDFSDWNENELVELFDDQKRFFVFEPGAGDDFPAEFEFCDEIEDFFDQIEVYNIDNVSVYDLELNKEFKVKRSHSLLDKTEAQS